MRLGTHLASLLIRSICIQTIIRMTEHYFVWQGLYEIYIWETTFNVVGKHRSVCKIARLALKANPILPIYNLFNRELRWLIIDISLSDDIYVSHIDTRTSAHIRAYSYAIRNGTRRPKARYYIDVWLRTKCVLLNDAFLMFFISLISDATK